MAASVGMSESTFGRIERARIPNVSVRQLATACAAVGLKFAGRGYDCSGTVSFALNGGGLIQDPLDSSGFFSWGDKGPGTWITVYTKSSHAFMVIAGLRLDTSAAGDPSGAKGPRWRPVLRSTRGFKARHPEGL